MMSRARLLATVLLLPVAFSCGKREEQPSVTTQLASPPPGIAATEAPSVAWSPAATTTTPPKPAGTAAPKAPSTTQATQPQALPAAPAVAASAPPPTTQAEAPAASAPPAGQRPKGKITLPAKLGAVTFDHENHAGKLGIACRTCHHPSRPQKPLASENQACHDCHTMPAAPPMKASLQAAFHDPKGATGTCVDCHKQKGGRAPVKCLECHKKQQGRLSAQAATSRR